MDDEARFRVTADQVVDSWIFTGQDFKRLGACSADDLASTKTFFEESARVLGQWAQWAGEAMALGPGVAQDAMRLEIVESVAAFHSRHEPVIRQGLRDWLAQYQPVPNVDPWLHFETQFVSSVEDIIPDSLVREWCRQEATMLPLGTVHPTFTEQSRDLG